MCCAAWRRAARLYARRRAAGRFALRRIAAAALRSAAHGALATQTSVRVSYWFRVGAGKLYAAPQKEHPVQRRRMGVSSAGADAQAMYTYDSTRTRVPCEALLLLLVIGMEKEMGAACRMSQRLVQMRGIYCTSKYAILVNADAPRALLKTSGPPCCKRARNMSDTCTRCCRKLHAVSTALLYCFMQRVYVAMRMYEYK